MHFSDNKGAPMTLNQHRFFFVLLLMKWHVLGSKFRKTQLAEFQFKIKLIAVLPIVNWLGADDGDMP